MASVSTNGDGRVASGEILSVAKKYVVVVNGTAVGGAVGTSQAAAERLIHALADRLPRRPKSWGASVNCAGEGLGVAFGNLSGGGGGGRLHPCAAQVLRGRKFEALEEALKASAQIIGKCCG